MQSSGVLIPIIHRPLAVTRLPCGRLCRRLLLTLLAIVIAYGTTKISDLFNQASEAGIKLDTILMVMSNMVVIPQLILIFAMLNIFSYNSFQTHIGFIWWVSLAIIIVGHGFFEHLLRTCLIRKMGSQAKK